jgi:hypothetical protein
VEKYSAPRFCSRMQHEFVVSALAIERDSGLGHAHKCASIHYAENGVEGTQYTVLKLLKGTSTSSRSVLFLPNASL